MTLLHGVVQEHGQEQEQGLPASSRTIEAVSWRTPSPSRITRELPEETAVAFSYNRVSHAVMMASPCDLFDFAVGFSVTEGIIQAVPEIEELEVIPVANGIELRMWVVPDSFARLAGRRRNAAGPTGCGLCGVESLDQAMRVTPVVQSQLQVTASEILAAIAALEPAQTLHRATRAVHAAGFVRPGAGLIVVREDVGRHNALDKLAGALARAGADASEGMVVMTSRVSVELVQKLAAMGAAMLVAVSAPTALALRVAEQAGITIVGVARADGFEVFTHPDRIVDRIGCQVTL